MKRVIKNYEFFFVLVALKITLFYLMTDFNIVHIVLTLAFIISAFQMSIYSGNKFIYKGFYVLYGVISAFMFLEVIWYAGFDTWVSYQSFWQSGDIKTSIYQLITYIKLYHIVIFGDLIVYYAYKRFFEKKSGCFICSPKSSKISLAMLVFYIMLTVGSKAYQNGEFFSYHIADLYNGVQNHELVFKNQHFLGFLTLDEEK